MEGRKVAVQGIMLGIGREAISKGTEKNRERAVQGKMLGMRRENIQGQRKIRGQRQRRQLVNKESPR